SRQPDPVEIAVAEVRHLQAVAPMQDDAVHALVPELCQLEAHLVRVELAVQEPEREDAEGAVALAEPAQVHSRFGHDTCTVPFTTRVAPNRLAHASASGLVPATNSSFGPRSATSCSMSSPMNPAPMITTSSPRAGAASSTAFTAQAMGSPRASSSGTEPAEKQ